MLHRQRLASATLALLLRFKLADSATEGTFTELHFFADSADAQALDFDHLSYLQIEACIKGSSGFLVVHVCCHLGLKKPIFCLFKLERYVWLLLKKISTRIINFSSAPSLQERGGILGVPISFT